MLRCHQPKKVITTFHIILTLLFLSFLSVVLTTSLSRWFDLRRIQVDLVTTTRSHCHDRLLWSYHFLDSQGELFRPCLLFIERLIVFNNNEGFGPCLWTSCYFGRWRSRFRLVRTQGDCLSRVASPKLLSTSTPTLLLLRWMMTVLIAEPTNTETV